jgi:hypothetical protein
MTTEQAIAVEPMDDLLDALDDTPEEEGTVEDGELDTTDDTESATDEADSDEDAQAESTPDLIDLDGKKLAIPKGTPPELVKAVEKMAADLKADYTRKTQGAAEVARGLVLKEQNLQQQEQLVLQNAQRMAKLVSTQERLSQFEQIDWQALIDADPTQAQKLHITYQQEKAKAEQLQREFQQAQAQRGQAQQQMRAQVLQEAEAQLAKALPKWNADTKSKVMQNTLSYGYTPEDLANITDARLVVALHDAMQWRALQAKQKTVMQKVADAPRVVKPNAPQPRKTNQAAAERLRKTGRIEDLASLL